MLLAGLRCGTAAFDYCALVGRESYLVLALGSSVDVHYRLRPLRLPLACAECLFAEVSFASGISRNVWNLSVSGFTSVWLDHGLVATVGHCSAGARPRQARRSSHWARAFWSVWMGVVVFLAILGRYTNIICGTGAARWSDASSLANSQVGALGLIGHLLLCTELFAGRYDLEQVREHYLRSV